MFYIQEGKVRLTVVSKIWQGSNPWHIGRRESFSEKVVWPGSHFAWGLQPQ